MDSGEARVAARGGEDVWAGMIVGRQFFEAPEDVVADASIGCEY